MDDKSATHKPKRDARVQIAPTRTADGQPAFVLHHPGAHTYLQIDAQNYFLWQLMDGEHDLGGLAMAYFVEYHAFPFDRLSQLLAQLEANFLLEGTSPPVEPAEVGESKPRLVRLADTAFRREFNWARADEFFAGFYRRVGWVLFTRAALILFGLIAITGLASFVYLVWVWAENFRMFRVSNSYGVGIIVLLLANFIVLFWHESGHGLTCKLFGRRIRKAGMMFYYGMPAFFVDASDMWMAERRPRIVVSLAGPAVNVLIGSILAIIVLVLPPSTVRQVLFIAALVAYLSALLNLNPLLELDGYYVLIDVLQTGQLRQRSFDFIRKDLLSKVRNRGPFTRADKMYGVYGILATAFTALTVLFGIVIWKRELQTMVQHLAAGEDVLAVVLVAGLTIAAGTWLVVGLAARLAVWLGTARKQRRAVMEGGGRGP